MKIVLLGYMGSGKSTIGKALSEAMHLNFIDLDDYIAEKEQLSISKIFSNKGEVHFRNLETNYLNQLLTDESKGVLALGGGTPCYADNMKQVMTLAETSIYLQLSADQICHRLSNEKSQRPLIADLLDSELQTFVRKHLFERIPYYNHAVHCLPVGNLSVDEYVQKIMQIIESPTG